jgi:drug/metabolite transporter (DMT)-like permease
VSTFTDRRRRGGAASGLVWLGLTAVMWGLNWPVNKYVLAQVPPFTARAMTSVVGSLLFFAAATARRERLSVPPGQWRPLFVSALLNFTCWITLAALALVWLQSSEAVIIAYTMPIWTVLLALPILGERPRPAGLAGLALGVLGVAILIFGQPLHASWAKLPGAGFGFAGAVLFALGTVLGKRMPVRLPPLASIGWQLAIGCIPIIVLALAFDHADLHTVTPLGWAGLLYNAMIGLGLGYVTWFAALRVLPASTTATGSLMVPVMGVVCSGLLLGEPLGLRQLAALLLTLAGVALAARR